MDLTGGMRATIAAAGTVMLAGLTAVLHGIVRSNVTHAAGGACLAFVATTLIALIFIRSWIVDTRDERRVLAAATRAARDERTRYIALEAALENEQARRKNDLATERAQIAAKLLAEREAMWAEFEEERSELACQTMEVTIKMMRGDKLTPEEKARCNLIPFPQQQPQTERARSREHGVVSP